MMKFITDSNMPHNPINIQRYDFFIFDLDDTLYNEKLYLFAAYKKISVHLANLYGLNEAAVEKFLVEKFEDTGRSNLFNKLCAEFNIPESAIKDMLITLRTVQLPKPIELFRNVRAFLETLLQAEKKLFVITNGNLQQQQNKINSIQWHGLKKDIEFIFASTFQPKPGRASFDYLVDKYKIQSEKCIYIGDTETDRMFAQNCDIAFLNANEILMEG